ncbi:MAG: hypothetical protein LBP52_05365 [Burkholderiaceae bacterium]|jgi:hypothetical protein|nr:hypothetical protein [Burkholderiaceae bacterium]
MPDACKKADAFAHLPCRAKLSKPAFARWRTNLFMPNAEGEVTMSETMEFTNALALKRGRLYLSASPDSMPAFSAHTRLFMYDESEEPFWTYDDVNWWNVALALWREGSGEDQGAAALCAMSQEGDVELLISEAPDAVYEKIPGAGVFSEGARGWGYMNSLRQIGNHLYACGGAGQVYRREGPDCWVHMDEGILQAPGVKERLLPSDINGPHESAIYFAGCVDAPGLPAFVFFRDGRTWRRLKPPQGAGYVARIFVESEARVWMCGQRGTLLLGNADDGFRNLLPTVDGHHFFTSMAMFEGRLYLASSLGLFVYDPASHAAGLRAVETHLRPGLQDANVVDACDGWLWSVGSKDIARFDGKRWERIHHPDNPPIE